MRRAKPILHGRDHWTGGADPIPGLGQTSVGRYEAFPTGGYTAGVSRRCDWSFDTGVALFDLSTPAFPLAIETGIYRIYANLKVLDDATVITPGALVEGEIDAGGETSGNFMLISFPILYIASAAHGCCATEDFLDPSNGDGPQASVTSTNVAAPDFGFTRIIVTFTPQTTLVT